MLSYLRSLLRLPWGVRLFLLSEMLFGLGAGVAVILNFHYLALGFDTRVIGLATAANAVATAVFSYPAGVITDRFGAKLTMVSGIFIVVLGYLGIAVAQTAMMLYLAQVLLGLGMSFILACEFPYIMSLCENKEDETTAYTLIIAAYTLSFSIGNIVGTKIPSHMPAGNTQYQSTIYLVAASFFIMWVLRCFLPTKSERVAAMQKDKPKKTSWRIVPSRQVLLFVTYATIGGFVYFLVGPFENIIMRERFGLSDGTVGLVFAISSFLQFLTSLFTPYLMKNVKRRAFLYTALGTHSLFLLLMGFSLPAVMYSAFLLFKGSAGTMHASFIDSSMMKATREEERGLHSGFRQLTRQLSGSLASGIGGFVLAAGNYQSIYFLVFIGTAVNILFYGLYIRHQLRKDLQENF